MIIYKTTNKINGKISVGKDVKNNPNYLGSGKRLLRAIKKYGRENFTKEILEICETQEQLNDCEKKWIEYLNSKGDNGYNIADGGTGGKTSPNPWNKGLTKFTSESVKKYSDKNKKSLKGKTQSEETKLKRKISNSGKKRSKETCEKISKSLRGKKLSKETKEKISNSLKGRKLSKESIEKMKNRKLSKETKEKISNSLKGRKIDPEITKKKAYNQTKKYFVYNSENELISTIFGKFNIYCKENKININKVKKFYNLVECIEFINTYYKVYIE